MKPPEFVFEPSRILIPTSVGIMFLYENPTRKQKKSYARFLRRLRREENRRRDRHDNFARGPRRVSRYVPGRIA